MSAMASLSAREYRCVIAMSLSVAAVRTLSRLAPDPLPSVFAVQYFWVTKHGISRDAAMGLARTDGDCNHISAW
jgi:hypothetical protein